MVPLKFTVIPQNYGTFLCHRESRYAADPAVATENGLMVERDTLYLHATSLNSWGTSSTTEENRYALASARCLVIMHRDLFDLDSQGGNWFYNLKQACTHAVIEAGEIPRYIAHACPISHARARPFTNHFP